MEYEIHITVDSNDIEKFKKVCQKIGAKPVLIDVTSSKQLMTSSKHKGVDKEYVSELMWMLRHLRGNGFHVSRSKIEIRPEKVKHKDFKYYESHIRLTLPKDFDKTQLINLCAKNKFHLSRNLFKSDDVYDYQMITYKDKFLSLVEFNRIIDNMKAELQRLNISFDKIEIEECIEDSHEKLDHDWLNQKIAHQISG